MYAEPQRASAGMEANHHANHLTTLHSGEQLYCCNILKNQNMLLLCVARLHHDKPG